LWRGSQTSTLRPEAGLDPAPWTTRRKLAVLFGALFVLACGIAYGYDRISAGNYYPGTRIGTVAVGSLTEAEAASELHDAYVKPLTEPITFTAPEFETTSTPWKMGMRIDTGDVARDALVTQRAERIWTRLWHRVVGASGVEEISPTVDDKVFDAFLADTYKAVNQDPKDARLDVSSDKLDVIPHRLGRKVDKKDAEAAVFAALTSGDRSVEIPVKVIQPELRTEAFKRVILVSTSANRLTYYVDGKVAKSYGVATGTGGFPTPRGQWRVTLKRMNPTWYNPNSDWSRSMPPFIPPGPNNPLGTRALNLNASGIRIHGTPDAASIGTNASHGCIRMHMRDIEELFEKVEVGTPVLIV
jgi:lipoprotein-anchoring transpeptidase ErfK/SrfK